jgi:type I restriction enzyme S subunit
MSSEWPVRPLEDCLDALIDYRGKTPEKTDSGIPLVTAKIIKDGRIERPSEFIASEAYESWMRRGIPQAGDVVLTTEAPMGEVAQLGSERVALAQRVVTLRGKVGLLDSTFLLYVLQTEEMQEQLRSRSTGTTVLGIKQSELRKISVSLPPIDLQRSSASTLAAIDARIDLLRETNATLEAIAQALFKSWFVDFDPVYAKQQGIAPAGMDEATAALFPDSFEESELGLVPVGWQVGPILDVASLLSGGTPRTDRSEYWGGTIAWASARDVSQSTDSVLVRTERTITRQGLEESATRIIPALASVVVARGATTGRMVLIGDAMAMNQTCYALISKINTPMALYCLLRREIDVLVRAAHGSVFDTITTNTFARSKVVQPSQPLLEHFEEIVSPLLQQMVVGTKASHALATLRDTLLPRLISGQLRLPEAEAHLTEAAA